MNKEIMFDKILKKFEGNKSFDWNAIHNADFYESIDRDYYVIENHINFLIGDNALKEDLGQISLSRKGWFMMTNSNTEGYEAKKKKEDKKKLWTIVLGIVSIATFVLVVIRFSNDFIVRKVEVLTTSVNDTAKKRNHLPSIDTSVKIKLDTLKK